MTFESIATLVTALGIGGLVGSYFQALWQRGSELQSRKSEFKETRYKCIILLMYAVLDFEKNAPLLRQHGRHFASLGDLIDELKTEWHNMMLFASDDALTALHAFIREPSVATYRIVVLAMRSDLWGGRLLRRIMGLDFNDTVSSAGQYRESVKNDVRETVGVGELPAA